MRIWRSCFYLLFLLPAFSFAEGMPVIKDFKRTYEIQGTNPQGQAKVILLLVSQPNCSYCIQITEEILKPMQISGNYDATTIFGEIEINTGQRLLDFKGTEIDANQFAQRYNAWATPTLLFLNGEGKEVAPKMIGVNTLELYGYYVDQAIEQGLAKINP